MTENSDDDQIQNPEMRPGDAESIDDSVDDQPVRRHPTASKTPFDYPFVFPALLFALGCWFGYDGWFNPDMEHKVFNQVLFFVFAVSFVWTLSVDYRIYKIQQRKKMEAETDTATEADEQVEESASA